MLCWHLPGVTTQGALFHQFEETVFGFFETFGLLDETYQPKYIFFIKYEKTYIFKLGAVIILTAVPLEHRCTVCCFKCPTHRSTSLDVYKMYIASNNNKEQQSSASPNQAVGWRYLWSKSGIE